MLGRAGAFGGPRKLVLLLAMLVRGPQRANARGSTACAKVCSVCNGLQRSQRFATRSGVPGS
eukprot:2636782-Alexandrium_andersonii.AAC.1